MKFRVRHEWRVGGLYRPAGPGKTGAVLMLHGFPGVHRNEDIASELCRRGLTVFLPHFRGCWGSGGSYSLHGLLEDAATALRLLTRYHHVDAQRVGLLGYSLGGWVALRLAGQSHVAATAVMAAALPRENVPEDGAYLRRNATVVRLPRVDDVWQEYLRAARKDRPEVYLRDVSPAPLLFIQGLRDRLVPSEAATKLWSLADRPKQLLELPNEGHEFQEDRPAVISAVCGWLQARLADARCAARRQPVGVGGDG